MAEFAGPDSEAEIARLLAACAGRDRRAFQQLYELTSGQLLACLVRILRNRALAEDALQDAFIQVWRRAAQFQRERGSAWAWLVAIARYRAIDIRRREVRRAAAGAEEYEDLPGGDEPHDTQLTLGHRAGAALDRCLGALQERQRECIVLAFQGGMTHVEVAERIGEPLGSVKSWIRRGLASLRRCLES